MKKSISLFMLALLWALLPSCNQSKTSSNQGPEYNPMISAFTSGIVSAESAIMVRFASPVTDLVVPDAPLELDFFSISPRVEGSVYYIDKQTIEFRPDQALKHGTDYDVKLKLEKLFPDLEEAKDFTFRFHTIDQHLSLNLEGFRPYNDYKPEKNYLTGTLTTADKANSTQVEQSLEVTQNKKKLPLQWVHDDAGLIHNFTVDSISREDKESELLFSFDGEAVGAEQKGERKYPIPSLGDFTVVNHRLIQYPEQHVILTFSDPIRKNQSLDGLIRFSNDTDLRFIVEGNSVQCYPNVRQNGTLNVFVDPGIRNTAGKGMQTAQSFQVEFKEIKPAIELIGSGVIIPSSDKVLLPFKAVNLKAVDVKVIHIYEDNIAQFLQVNKLSGERELKRAGRLVMKKTIDLVADKAINYGQWNSFSLDLTDLVKTEPGAIYRVELNFRRSQSMFPCADQDDDVIEEDEDFDEITDSELSYWDSYESYYNSWDYYYYDGYQYSDREDPCKPAYYGKRNAVARNILASNLGLIAKYSDSRQLYITVSDLLKAEALPNARVTVYNYQQQVIAEGTSDGGGMLELKPESKPFLVVAEHGGQKGYLRLVDGGALSYSMFDVSGSITQKGIKGYLYGERGVWRPGDSIFISLIVDDQANPLPNGHPVSFELKDPRGKVVQKKISTDNGSGFYSFHTTTDSEAPTGNYNLTAEVGGVRFSKSLRVETIKPNRLKIDLSFESDTLYPAMGVIRSELNGKWLTGATARDLRAEIEVSLRPLRTAFKGYEDYTFSNPARKLNSNATSYWEGKIDAEGHASFSEHLNISGNSPGMLNAIFTTRLFEKSGDFSIDQLTIPCSPYNTYVGIKTPPGDKRGMLLTDTSHLIKVVTLDHSGKEQTKLGLEAKVYKLSWRWWWDASTENLASYMGNRYQDLVYSTTLSTRNGTGSFNFKIPYPDWGRYLVIVSDKGGHSAAKIVYVDWPGYAGSSRKGDPSAAAVLSFSSDKKDYKVGETATVSIPSSQQGKILISLENGSGVLQQEWINTSSSETKYKFKVTPDMAPNIYVYAALLQPHKNTENDLPIRMFGVIPVNVEDPETRLYPELSMPDELKPNSKVSLTVSEKNKRKMTYTIAMVDEGLLDLTRFATPDPWASFYAKEALGVKTWDMFEDVLGAFGGRIDGIYNVGGGMDESGEGAKDANRFPPMVKFLGPFTLEGKKRVHEIQMPNYIGSVRTMVIAGNEGAYGRVEKTTPVKQPLMLLATLPRVLGPGEKVAMPVNVFVMDESIGKVNLEISSNDMLLADENKKSLEFTGTGDQIIDFNLSTPEKTGVGRVKVVATSGKHRAEYDIELDIRPSNPPTTKFENAALASGDSYSKEFDYIGMAGTNELMLEVSNIPPIDFGRRLKYLVAYPHGCIEQTSSAVFPQLFLADVVEVNEAMKQRMESNIKAGIRRLAKFQLASGGMSYWPGSIRENSWGTSYAGHFLIEAKEKGYDVPQAMLKNLLKYQRKEARRWNIRGSSNQYEIRQEQLMQAYRLFTLALGGSPELGSMNRLRERPDLLPEAKWRLAAAYALAGQNETARELASNTSTEVNSYYDSRYSFGSKTRDQAMILEAMILIGMKENGALLLEQIAQSLSSERWMSTQTTAYSLVAVAKFTGERLVDDKLSFEYSFNGEETKKAESSLSMVQIEFPAGEDLKGNIELKNNSKGMLFMRLVNTGVPAPGGETAFSNNLSLQVQYTDLDGKLINQADIEQGTDFKAVFTVRNPGAMGYLDNLALTAIFPPGWEIHNERMFSLSSDNESYTYQDIRDDRVLTYFTLGGGRSKTFTVRLNASYKGQYYLPSIYVEEMYKNNVNALIPGKWIDVSARE